MKSITFDADGHVSSVEISPPPHRVPDGYIKPAYIEPDESYFSWIYSLELSEIDNNPPKDALRLLIDGKKNYSDDFISVIELSERWDIPWKLIKCWIEEGVIAYKYYPVVRGIGLSDGKGINYRYIIGISTSEILQFEEKYPELKVLALKLPERRVLREEEKIKNQRRKEERELHKLLSICKKKGISIEKATELIERNNSDYSSLMDELTDLKKIVADRESRISSLDAQISKLSTDKISTVNATKWKDSVKAAFKVWADIFEGDKTDWIEDDFREALSRRCKDYHTDVHTSAWSLLPEVFKHGRGRPKKNPK